MFTSVNMNDNLEKHRIEILLATACNPLEEFDELICRELCDFVNQSNEASQITLRFLAHKSQSPLECEALEALMVLEKLVQNGCPKLIEELGKFRFLNEIIKVVSPKYLGHRSSQNIKNKIVELMFLWSMEIKEMPKIFEAYQMLRKQGIITEDPVHVLPNYKPATPPPPRAKDEVFDDEKNSQILRRLIQSGKPEDLQAANKLIKSLAQEADKRMGFNARFKTEIESVHNNCKVLSDMIELYVAGETSTEEVDLMKELYESCESLRLRLFKLANEIPDKDSPNMNVLFNANDELSKVINNYKKAFGIEITNNEGSLDKTQTNLIDIFQETSLRSSVDVALLDDHLTSHTTDDEKKAKIDLDDLNDIFNEPKTLKKGLNGDILIPESTSQKGNEKSKARSTFEELDALGRVLLKQNITSGDLKESNSKKSLNELQSQVKCTKNETDESQGESNLPKSLSNLFISLDAIEPSSQQPVLLYDQNDIKVNLYFTNNSPREDVKVMVITILNTSKHSISQVGFLAAIPKSMKVKLQPASGNTLSPYNAFLPPPAITQVMLIARNQSDEKVKLRYKFSYSIEDKQIIEKGEIDNLFNN